MTRRETTIPTPRHAERRRFQRVKVTLFGRYMLQDRSEHPCRVLDMSPGGVALQAERPGRPGERIIAYLDHIGRIEGRITRLMDGGFAMTIGASERKRDMLAAQLTWLANRHEFDLRDDRRHERVVLHNPACAIQLPGGELHPCRIIDLSLSGAAVTTQTRPPVGSLVFLGPLRSEVVRHFDDGIAVEFAVVQEHDALLATFSQ